MFFCTVPVELNPLDEEEEEEEGILEAEPQIELNRAEVQESLEEADIYPGTSHLAGTSEHPDDDEEQAGLKLDLYLIIF